MSTSVVASASTSADGPIWMISGSERGDGADAGEADRGDIDEVAAANAVVLRSPVVPETSADCALVAIIPLCDAYCLTCRIGTSATPRRQDARRDWRA